MASPDPDEFIPPRAILPSGPIEYWSAVGDIDQVQQAINEGHDVNASDDAGYTALHAAAENNHLDIINLLLRHGADVTAVVRPGMTPTDLARLAGHDEVVKVLTE